MEEGEPYIWEESNFGDNGTLETSAPEGLSEPTFVDMLRLSPRRGMGGLPGVEGPAMAESSLETRRYGSRKAGEGESTGLGASERDRGLLGEPLIEVL